MTSAVAAVKCVHIDTDNRDIFIKAADRRTCLLFAAAADGFNHRVLPLYKQLSNGNDDIYVRQIEERTPAYSFRSPPLSIGCAALWTECQKYSFPPK